MKQSVLYSILCSLFLLCLLLSGFDQTSTQVDEKDLTRLQATIRKSAITCYSVEGFYPRELSYLEENYDIHIDEERYRIHYEWVADNLQPDIRVFVKGDE